MTENKARQVTLNRKKKATEETVRSLIIALDSEDGRVRTQARKSLVAVGGQSVKSLIEALASKKQLVRWEAAKTLGQIGDPAAVQALVRTLEDKIFDIRWLAAEGLIHIGRKALVPLLQALIDHPDSLWLKEGAHHVLHDINKGEFIEIIQPVIFALESFEPSVEGPLAISHALKALKKNKALRDSRDENQQ